MKRNVLGKICSVVVTAAMVLGLTTGMGSVTTVKAAEDTTSAVTEGRVVLYDDFSGGQLDSDKWRVAQRAWG